MTAITLELLEHLFATVSWIPNQFLIAWIDDEVQILQGNLADQCRNAIGNLQDIGRAEASLNG